jgi:hypothetical protein
MSDVPTSFIIETNKGGMPITICSCGVLMFKPMALDHIADCAVAQAQLSTEAEANE